MPLIVPPTSTYSPIPYFSSEATTRRMESESADILDLEEAEDGSDEVPEPQESERAQTENAGGMVAQQEDQELDAANGPAEATAQALRALSPDEPTTGTETCAAGDAPAAVEPVAAPDTKAEAAQGHTFAALARDDEVSPVLQASAAVAAAKPLPQPAPEPVAVEPQPAGEPAAAEPPAEKPDSLEPKTAAVQRPASAAQPRAAAPSTGSSIAARTEAPVMPAAAPAAIKPATAAAVAGELTSPREAAPKEQRKPHKETTVERLTTPTAMRMLHTLEQTQGSKTTFHIGSSGAVYKGKKLAPDELTAMVDRLAVPKHVGDAALPPKPHAVKLVYEDNREQLVPVKEVTKDENISYMAELYERCKETRKKTQQTLADKYLQPLIKPKAIKK